MIISMASGTPGGAYASSNPVFCSTSRGRIAVIDADSAVCKVLDNRFKRDGWSGEFFTSQIPVSELISMRINALVIDAGVLGDGFWGYLAEVSSSLPSLPIIACSTRSTVATRVRGLRSGLVDWVAKPGHPEEMMARIEVAVKGVGVSKSSPVEAVSGFGALEIRPAHFQVFVNGESAELTKREYELVRLLAAADGRVLSREEIYEKIWGYTMAHGDRSVDVFVRKLRKKLEGLSPEWKYIHTHFGFGYRFSAEPNVPAETVEPVRTIAPRSVQSSSKLNV